MVSFERCYLAVKQKLQNTYIVEDLEIKKVVKQTLLHYFSRKQNNKVIRKHKIPSFSVTVQNISRIGKN